MEDASAYIRSCSSEAKPPFAPMLDLFLAMICFFFNFTKHEEDHRFIKGNGRGDSMVEKPLLQGFGFLTNHLTKHLTTFESLDSCHHPFSFLLDRSIEGDQ